MGRGGRLISYKVSRHLLEVAFGEFERLQDFEKRMRPSASEFFSRRLAPAVHSFVSQLRSLDIDPMNELMDTSVGILPREYQCLSLLRAIWERKNQPEERVPITTEEMQEMLRQRQRYRDENERPETEYLYRMYVESKVATLNEVVTELNKAVVIVDTYVAALTGSGTQSLSNNPQECSPLVRERRTFESPNDPTQPLSDESVEYESQEEVGSGAKSPAKPRRRKTVKGKAREELISALTKHHKYEDGGCLNTDFISVRELAGRTGLSVGSASNFFNRQFNEGKKGGGHDKYKLTCRDPGALSDAIKAMRGEFTPAAMSRLTRKAFEAGRHDPADD
ncbi:MAG: hypothetical protein J5I93_07350 [Pirellulaceae bacterium]|nr:hypothetical protein [Pirellulaceae bacterium]